MQVNIGSITNSIHALSSEELLSPRVLERIVAQVLRAVDERHEHRERVNQERRTMGGTDDWENKGNC